MFAYFILLWAGHQTGSPINRCNLNIWWISGCVHGQQKIMIMLELNARGQQL
jgi:hypothetical protein